jgi:5-methylcytosine-specific restriction endonuclease McrA
MGKRVYDWSLIQQYHDEGHGFVDCQRQFGFSHTACRRVYDWTAVQAYYEAGHTYRECRAKFGFCAASWTKAVKRGELTARARTLPVPVLLATAKSRASVRRRLLMAGILENICEVCGLREWQGKPISMQIDHINGIRDDHRLENLRMLCPNCHSQTPTFSGRNVKRGVRLQDGREAV